MLISEAFLFEVLLNCNLLAKPFSQVDLTVTALSDRFNNLYLLFRDQEVKLDTFLRHVFFNFCLHILLRSVLLALSALFFLSVLFLSLLFLLLSLAIRWWWRGGALTIVLFFWGWPRWWFFGPFHYLSSLVLLFELSLLYFLNHIKSEFLISEFTDSITKTLALENEF